MGSLRALFGFDLGANGGAFFFLDLLQAELLALVFLDGVADFVFDFFRGLLELTLGLAHAAGEFGELGTSEKEQDNEENDPDNGAVKHGEVEGHSRIAVAVIG